MKFLKKMLFLTLIITAASFYNLKAEASVNIKSTIINSKSAVSKSNAILGTVTANSLVVRSGPNTKYSVIGGLRSNEKVSILSLQSGWYKINFKTGVGYVAQSYIKTNYMVANQSDSKNEDTTIGDSNNTVTGEVFVGYTTATALNVRSGPSTVHNVVKVLFKGEEVVVLESQKDWLKISKNNSIGWVSSEYIILTKASQGTENINKKTIVIDAGHGGFDPGSIGPTGIKEKNITLAVSLMIGNILESQGHKVIYTRKNDSITWAANEKDDVRARVDISSKAKADLFISIHTNASEYSSIKGIETYFSYTNSNSKLLAKFIQDNMIKSLKLSNRGIKEENFYVIKNNQAVSALVELAYISNSAEEKLLNNSSYQQKWADAVAKGINEYLRENK
jgi:N-acetylmuramoyl-L-alanine amidase